MLRTQLLALGCHVLATLARLHGTEKGLHRREDGDGHLHRPDAVLLQDAHLIDDALGIGRCLGLQELRDVAVARVAPLLTKGFFILRIKNCLYKRGFLILRFKIYKTVTKPFCQPFQKADKRFFYLNLNLNLKF